MLGETKGYLFPFRARQILSKGLPSRDIGDASIMVHSTSRDGEKIQRSAHPRRQREWATKHAACARTWPSENTTSHLALLSAGTRLDCFCALVALAAPVHDLLRRHDALPALFAQRFSSSFLIQLGEITPCRESIRPLHSFITFHKLI